MCGVDPELGFASAGLPYLFATGTMWEAMAEGYRDQPCLEKPYGKVALLHTLADILARS